ncbi:MAG: 7-cyano-7-deazaguanine synthase QueC [Candidatus Omnitrophica bacterium]|jgi:7-cyano-7-deazaguanine synthase|nr:7-cyano-7-deazaguanine synthase QueC [Candidatus Omnitrophota bacterium]MDD3274793.1 7-cyano-7-deazaguanine synthase QueC [Candidatus Omnitrophota bacterium]MDD5078573.1 7-cyano-7-deazaguanine synthase QueC [Candidatus Omnitrophota bacterium]MDD5725325.1 7-cyano-7-deazaguanine synthase QueC [Candidatus Omnitrophota bacterium]
MKNKNIKTAVVLLSGGLDSATVLYLAKAQGYSCRALVFDYGQKHRQEIFRAVKVAGSAGVPHTVLKISLPWKGSALLDDKIKVPERISSGIPVTYVPARNIIFLSFALSFAEVLKAQAIFIGAHAQDYSGYPDCRPEFFKAFAGMAAAGTAAGKKIAIKVPLLNKDKSEIISLGYKLGVPFGLTWSCYRNGKKPCGKCDSCYYRAKGFHQAGIADPLFKSRVLRSESR